MEYKPGLRAEALYRLRTHYNKVLEPRKLYPKPAIALAILVAIGIAMDFTLPFTGWANSLRALIALASAIVGYSIAYWVGLYFHYARRGTEWVPFRNRFSLQWRRSLAIIAGSALIVLMWASVAKPGYTLTATVIMMGAMALLAFIRPTKREAVLEEQGIPDPRDADFYTRKRLSQEAMEEREQARKEKRKERLDKLKGVKS